MCFGVMLYWVYPSKKLPNSNFVSATLFPMPSTPGFSTSKHCSRRFKFTLPKYLWTRSRAWYPNMERNEVKKMLKLWKSLLEEQCFKLFFWQPFCYRYSPNLADDIIGHWTSCIIDITSIFTTSDKIKWKTALKISAKNHSSDFPFLSF